MTPLLQIEQGPIKERKLFKERFCLSFMVSNYLLILRAGGNTPQAKSSPQIKIWPWNSRGGGSSLLPWNFNLPLLIFCPRYCHDSGAWYSRWRHSKKWIQANKLWRNDIQEKYWEIREKVGGENETFLARKWSGNEEWRISFRNLPIKFFHFTVVSWATIIFFDEC